MSYDGASRHELLGAVGELLAREVVPALSDERGGDRRLAFRVRIAANLLRIAVGEETQGPPPAVGDSSEDRRGEQAELVAALRHKLAVVNPGFDLSEDVD